MAKKKAKPKRRVKIKGRKAKRKFVRKTIPQPTSEAPVPKPEGTAQPSQEEQKPVQ